MKFLLFGILLVTNVFALTDYIEDCGKNHSKALEAQITEKIHAEVDTKAKEYFINFFSTIDTVIDQTAISVVDIDDTSNSQLIYTYKVDTPLETHLFSLTIEKSWSGYDIHKLWNISAEDNAEYDEAGVLVTPATQVVCEAFKYFSNRVRVVNLDGGIGNGCVVVQNWIKGTITYPL